MWTPSLAGEAYAQELYTGARDPARALNDYRHQVASYYETSGHAARNPEKAAIHTLRWTLRAVGAPLLLGVEKELAAHVSELQASDSSIPARLLNRNSWSSTFIRKRVQNAHHTPYTVRQWAFLEAAGFMAHRAGIRFLAQTRQRPNERMATLFDLYTKVDNELAGVNVFDAGYTIRRHARERFLDNAITSNATVLHTLEVARRHGVEKAVGQLGWLASAGPSFFNKYFGEEALCSGTAESPFVSAEQQVDAGSIWKAQPLDKGPWPSRRYCHENVQLWDSYHYVTAATERLRTVIPLARQLLWDA
ncbi:MAG TPA: hypothetical protein VLF62_00160 [Candidatus Saccharimonadales bacterium]|nr:hypothetical protein [Candidatus Saccharimonadales bacterium]